MADKSPNSPQPAKPPDAEQQAPQQTTCAPNDQRRLAVSVAKIPQNRREARQQKTTQGQSNRG